MDDDIKAIIMNHERRITQLEANMKNLTGWTKSIDKRLNKIEDDVGYIRGRIDNLKGNSNGGISRKELITIISLQATALATVIMIFAKVMFGG